MLSRLAGLKCGVNNNVSEIKKIFLEIEKDRFVEGGFKEKIEISKHSTTWLFLRTLRRKKSVCVKRGLQVAGGFRLPDLPPVTVDDGPQRGERVVTASSPQTCIEGKNNIIYPLRPAPPFLPSPQITHLFLKRSRFNVSDLRVFLNWILTLQ